MFDKVSTPGIIYHVSPACQVMKYHMWFTVVVSPVLYTAAIKTQLLTPFGC